MKKLLFSVFCMMLVCMAVVLSFTAAVRAILSYSGVTDQRAYYAVSIAGGFLAFSYLRYCLIYLSSED